MASSWLDKLNPTTQVDCNSTFPVSVTYAITLRTPLQCGRHYRIDATSVRTPLHYGHGWAVDVIVGTNAASLRTCLCQGHGSTTDVAALQKWLRYGHVCTLGVVALRTGIKKGRDWTADVNVASETAASKKRRVLTSQRVLTILFPSRFSSLYYLLFSPFPPSHPLTPSLPTLPFTSPIPRLQCEAKR